MVRNASGHPDPGAQRVAAGPAAGHRGAIAQMDAGIAAVERFV